MVAKHYVLFKFKSDAPLEDITTRLFQLKSIDGVSNMFFGKTFTDRHKGYTHILSMDCPDRQGLQYYSEHPDHVAFVQECVKPYIETDGVLAMDIEQ
jgi:hypothetical protein